MVKKSPILINEERLVKQQNEVNLQGTLILFVAVLEAVRLALSKEWILWLGLALGIAALIRIVGNLLEE